MTQSLRTRINKPHNSDWVETRLSRVARFRNGSDYKHVEVDEPGFPVYGSGGQFRWSSDWLYDGDSVLFGRKGTIDKPLFATGKFWTVDTMYFTEVDPGYLLPKFFYYWATLFPFDYYSTDTALPSITQSDLGSEPIWLPSLEEQRQIADYLDHETAEIDAFINDQQKFIELLVEHRMASVGTKIRYPSIFHDSSLLKHELAPLKRFGHVSLGKMLDTKAASGDDLHLDYLRAANVQPMGWLKLDDMKKMRFTTNEKRALDLREGDVVVVEGGVGGYGRAAFVPKDLPETGFQNSIIRVRPTLDNDGRYLTYALILLRHRGYITTVSSVASMPHFTAEKVARTPIPIATLDEQRGIADSLDDLWQSHEVLSSEAAQAIALARERRAALITAAVTGQIDVTAKNKPAAEQLEDDIAQGLYKES